ncbi:alpha-D-phosphohexomutase [Candidatus Nitrososphaera gargensis Ga9.2]|uniref:Alpha-D-phosphohexomutase n=1 Tax=Nitrososphaera gargensis (strain Ga9.2) TaxID=1237085 RepID=K0I807_NITGG|nr:alpha-D-phosphohexomutase [Candidatus Nitrososphaera gargensis]AFU57406.1 alpha-D-phosphohexomutase [Candidatus Nitrososphaera gargensis Ga9.2]
MKISISGVRGVYGQDLNLHEVSIFASQFASVIKSGKCVVARDTRPSGMIIAQTVVAGLMAGGVDVYNLGVAPTPAAFREARRFGAGVIITASHNPLEWNGLKFIIEGRGLFERELAKMLKSVGGCEGKFGSEFRISSRYVDEVADVAKGGAKVKVGIDPGGGAACGYGERLFKKLGHQYHSINGVAGVSSRGPDPTADELADLRALVTANKLDHGFALDLDADRLVVVNNMGEKLNPDATLLLCVARSLEMGMKKFVTSIDTSVAIEKYVRDHKGKISYSKVGEANVVSKMLEVDAEAGGEGSSAGFIMPKFNMCRDGLLAAATISTLDKKTIDSCLKFASQFVQIRSKITAESAFHKKVIEKLPDIFKRDASSIMTEDGVKAIIDDDSWVLVRPSNTEHAIRVSVESRAGKAQALFKDASEKVQAAYDQVR